MYYGGALEPGSVRRHSAVCTKTISHPMLVNSTAKSEPSNKSNLRHVQSKAWEALVRTIASFSVAVKNGQSERAL